MVDEERKRAAHTEACHAVGVSFVSLVVESIGGWSEEAATCRINWRVERGGCHL